MQTETTWVVASAVLGGLIATGLVGAGLWLAAWRRRRHDERLTGRRPGALLHAPLEGPDSDDTRVLPMRMPRDSARNRVH